MNTGQCFGDVGAETKIRREPTPNHPRDLTCRCDGAIGLTCSLVGTRGDVLLLVRRQAGGTVSQLAEQLGVSGVAVRRHLAALFRLGLVERVAPSDQADDGHRGAGRPPGGWRGTGPAPSGPPG